MPLLRLLLLKAAKGLLQLLCLWVCFFSITHMACAQEPQTQELQTQEPRAQYPREHNLQTQEPQAQYPQEQGWVKYPGFSFTHIGLCADGGKLAYVASDIEIAVYQTDTGTVLWHKQVTEISPKLGKIVALTAIWQGEFLLLKAKYQGKYAGKYVLACVSITSGDIIWLSDSYADADFTSLVYLPANQTLLMATPKGLVLLDAKTGDMLWVNGRALGSIGKVLDIIDGNIVVVTTKPSPASALPFGKNLCTKINLKNGETVWENPYLENMDQTVVTHQPVCTLQMADSTVVLEGYGRQVFNYYTGAERLAAVYAPNMLAMPEPAHVGQLVAYGAYGKVAKPLQDSGFLYVLSAANKYHTHVKKIEIATARELWQSSGITASTVLPKMYLHKNMMVVQQGGTIEQQYVITKQTPAETITQTSRENALVGPFGLYGFNAGNGKQVWAKNRWPAGILNTFLAGDTLFVGTKVSFIALDIKTGAEIYALTFKAEKLGEVAEIIKYKTSAVAIGKRGIAVYSLATGALQMPPLHYNSATLLVKNGGSISGSTLVLQARADRVVVCNLETGLFKTHKANSATHYKLSNDGQYVYLFTPKSRLSGSSIRKVSAP